MNLRKKPSEVSRHRRQQEPSINKKKRIAYGSSPKNKRSRLVELLEPNLGALKLPSTATLNAAPSLERCQLQRALHGAHASFTVGSFSHHVGLAGVDEGPLTHCLEQQGPAGLWARDTLLHTTAMFLYGSVPQALHKPPPAIYQKLQQPQQAHRQQLPPVLAQQVQTHQDLYAHQNVHQQHSQPQHPSQLAIPSMKINGGSHKHTFGRQNSNFHGQDQQDRMQAQPHCRPGILAATLSSGSHALGNNPPGTGGSASKDRVNPILPWGGFRSVFDPLAQAVSGLVGPDWLYDLPPAGKGSEEPGALARIAEVEERVQEAWCPSRLDMPPRGSLEALLLEQVAAEQQTPLYYEPELPPGCEPSSWPLTPTSLLKVPQEIYKQGSLLHAPRLPKLRFHAPSPSPSQPPPPGHVFWAITEQDLAEWTQPDQRRATCHVQLLLNRVLGMQSEGPSDSLGLLLGNGKPVHARDEGAKAGTLAEERHAALEEAGSRDGTRVGSQHLVELDTEGLEEGAGPAAVRVAVQALRTTLRHKYVSSLQVHAYAPRALLDMPLGLAVCREGAHDMDVPYYMLAFLAQNKRLFGMRRRLWREWAANQGPQYRYLERFRDPWQEAKEEVEHMASILLLGPGSRDYPALLSSVLESDLLHAAREGRMPLNWRRRHWRQQQQHSSKAYMGPSSNTAVGLEEFDRLRDSLSGDGMQPGIMGGDLGASEQEGNCQGKGVAVSLLGAGNEEMEVLGAINAYRDLLGRPQRGSPGQLVYQFVTLQQMLQSLNICVHPCPSGATHLSADTAMRDMQACVQAQQACAEAGQQPSINIAVGLGPSQVPLLVPSRLSQVHTIIITDDLAVEESGQGRASAFLSWSGLLRGDYLPGSHVMHTAAAL